MADFTIRVELHGASFDDYRKLHDAMFTAGATMYITGDDGRAHVLPTAEYDLLNSALTVEQVRDQVATIAAPYSHWKLPWVLVTQVAARAWSSDPLSAANAA
jgi:hypothetical protein